MIPSSVILSHASISNSHIGLMNYEMGLTNGNGFMIIADANEMPPFDTHPVAVHHLACIHTSLFVGQGHVYSDS